MTADLRAEADPCGALGEEREVPLRRLKPRVQLARADHGPAASRHPARDPVISLTTPGGRLSGAANTRADAAALSGPPPQEDKCSSRANAPYERP